MENKYKSRKFIAWIICSIFAFLILGFCLAVIIVTKECTSEIVELLKSTAGGYMLMTGAYFGFNAGQKVGTAFAEKNTESEETE